MNRVDFMSQLERLLQNIAPAERDEALQYYNDYFDDAGAENEQEVIEALGNPARVAENIKRDLLGSGYGGEQVPRAQASDRALVEYGKETASGEEAPEKTGGGFAEGVFSGEASGSRAEKGEETAQHQFYFGQAMAGNTGNKDEDPLQGDQYGRQEVYENYEGTARKAGMPPWAIALLVTLLIFGSPIGLGLLGMLFGVVICWYAMILCAGVAAVALLIVLVVLVVIGILCCFFNPWVGMALVGGGLVCGGIGLLFLMLTVAMAGIVTPAFWRGMGRLFKRRRAGR